MGFPSYEVLLLPQKVKNKKLGFIHTRISTQSSSSTIVSYGSDIVHIFLYCSCTKSIASRISYVGSLIAKDTSCPHFHENYISDPIMVRYLIIHGSFQFFALILLV